MIRRFEHVGQDIDNMLALIAFHIVRACARRHLPDNDLVHIPG